MVNRKNQTVENVPRLAPLPPSGALPNNKQTPRPASPTLANVRSLSSACPSTRPLPLAKHSSAPSGSRSSHQSADETVRSSSVSRTHGLLSHHSVFAQLHIQSRTVATQRSKRLAGTAEQVLIYSTTPALQLASQPASQSASQPASQPPRRLCLLHAGSRVLLGVA